MRLEPRHWAVLFLLISLVACAAPKKAPAPPIAPPQACDKACLDFFAKSMLQALEDIRIIRDVMLYQLHINSPEGIGVAPQA